MNIITEMDNLAIDGQIRPIDNWCRRAIIVMSDCGSSPLLANLISGYLASIGIKHGYLSYDRTMYAVANGFGRLGFNKKSELVEVCQSHTMDLAELAKKREWRAIVVDNVEIAVWQTNISRDAYIHGIDHVAREVGIPIFCISVLPRINQ